MLINNLSFSYPDLELLKNVNLNLPKGGHFALIGANGSGKTTFFRLLAHELEPDCGQIIKQGQTIFVKQFSSQNQSKSPGQQQLARLKEAFLKHPELLLLDEPTANLDQAGINLLVTWIKKNHHTLIVISHDIYFLQKIADNILFLNQQTITLYPGNLQNFNAKYQAAQNKQYQLYEAAQKKHKKQQKAAQKMLEKANRAKKGRNLSNSDRKAQSLAGKYDKIERALARNAKKMRRKAEANLRYNKPYEQMGFKLLTTYQNPQKITLNLAFTGLKIQEKELITQPFYLRIASHDHIALLGANGVGKSSLIKQLFLMLKPKYRVTYFQQEIQDIWQPTQNMLTQLQTKAGVKSQIILDVAGALGLKKELLLKLPSQLSGGQLLKAQLILQLVLPFDILLLDEPTNYLDYDGVLALSSFIKQSSAAIIFISHDENFVRNCATKAYFIGNQHFYNYLNLDDYFQ